MKALWENLEAAEQRLKHLGMKNIRIGLEQRVFLPLSPLPSFLLSFSFLPFHLSL